MLVSLAIDVGISAFNDAALIWSFAQRPEQVDPYKDVAISVNG